MFVLKKVIAPFLLPPGLIVLLGAAALIGALKQKNPKAAWICFLLSTLLWGFSIVPTADLVVKPLLAGLELPAKPQADVIIMLGGGIHEGTPDLSGVGAPSFGTMERLVTAARLQRRLGIPILVSGGRLSPAGPAIAPIAGRFLIDLGVPPAMVLLEDQSRDTYENALFSKKICDQRGLRRPLLVTSGTHMKRALYSFESVGFKATAFPCGLIARPQTTFHWGQLLPSATNLHTTAMGLHEWLGILYYRLRY